MSSKKVREWIDQKKDKIIDDLVEFLKIPSVSTDPKYSGDIMNAVKFLSSHCKAIGLDTKVIESDDGYPLVYAEKIVDPNKKTILFYGHYDVQPPDPLDEWESPPFSPSIRDGNIYARGATDDKGQLFIHLKAVEYLLESNDLQTNVKFIFEGEEESGGETIEAFVIQDQGKLLACDAVFISDSAMYAPGYPSVVYGLRGMVYTEIRVSGPSNDLHSGVFGGPVVNPANALALIIGKFIDEESGKVTIPNFYEEVKDIEEWERKEWAQLPFDEKKYKESIGVPELAGGEKDYSILERIWARPTCDVNGIFGGYQGVGGKTIIPAWAGAKVSMRLVPWQTPENIFNYFEHYVRYLAPVGVNVDVELLSVARPVLINLEGEIFRLAENAIEEVWGRKPVKVREGGTIPIVSTFFETLGVPILLVGFGLPDDGLHSPNEKFSLNQLFKGIETVSEFLVAVGNL